MEKELREEFGLKINKSNTKVMTSCRSVSSDSLNNKFAINRIQLVDEFNYFVNINIKDVQGKNHIMSIPAQDRRAFCEKKHLLLLSIGLEVRKRFMKINMCTAQV